MKFIQPQNRSQVTFTSLEDTVAPDNAVRLIDAFVEHLDLSQLKFNVSTLNNEGRPSFESKVFLKLYFYGYLNGIRSSRRLEKECSRNTELQWLLGQLKPNYHSIADFRKDNPRALRNTFKLFVLFLKDASLVSGQVVAIDGTKIRAHNSKKNNYSPNKIKRHLTYIENKTAEYLNALDALDKTESLEKVHHIAEKIKHLKENKIKYEALGVLLDATGEPQVSTTDADARALLVQGQVVEISYNVETAVDSQHKLVVATHTINRNDRNALAPIALEAKDNLSADNFTLLADKGFYNSRHLQTCINNNITTLVAIPEMVNSNNKGTTTDYLTEKFIYNKAEDTYTCPANQTLHTNGTWYTKTKTVRSIPYRYRKFHTGACATCAVKSLCTAQAKRGRFIERSEFAAAAEQNAQHYKANWDLYRKRQEINEHIFGTIKRKWGYNHTNLTGLEKVNGEMALIMTLYNFKRVINILGFDDFLNKLKKWKPDYTKIILALLKTRLFKALYRHSFFWDQLSSSKTQPC
jgi:transposase